MYILKTNGLWMTVNQKRDSLPGHSFVQAWSVTPLQFFPLVIIDLFFIPVTVSGTSPFLRRLLRVDWRSCEHDADLILPDFSIADIHCVLPFLYGYAEESSEIKGSLLDCLQLGKYFGKKIAGRIGNISLKTGIFTKKITSKYGSKWMKIKVPLRIF